MKRSRLPAIIPTTVLAITLLASLYSTAGDAPAAKLTIVSAVYGNLADDKTADVTQKVIALVNNNSLSVIANTTAFGDPAPKSPKQLKVSYTIDGIYRSKTVDENATLDISTRLIIVKAVYGGIPKGPSADVTEEVTAEVRKNTLTLTAGNEAFGDPANGVVKQLQVDYLYDGVRKSKSVNEGETIKLPETAQNR